MLTLVDIEKRWKGFSESLAREVREAAARPLPSFCVSEQGLTHRIVDCRYTACGWHWAKSQCRTAENVLVTCRKCSGVSIRWGADAAV